MTASYPSAYRQWTTKRNYLDIVWAEHMNSIQDETLAIQQTLGVIPQTATANPGMVNPNHGTVAARIQSVARGEQIPIFRGSTRENSLTAGVWVKPSLRADDDPFSMSTGTGARLNESGLWCITLKCDWKSIPATVQHEAARLLRLEVDGVDIGVRDVIQEGPHNQSLLHNTLTWTETFAKNTLISMGVRTNTGGSPGALAYNAYMRLHLVRCHPVGEGGSLPFEEIPDEHPPTVPPNEVVVTPPDAIRKYTVIARLDNEPARQVNPITGFLIDSRAAGTVLNISIIDNTHPAFARSPYPKFVTRAEAEAYATQLRNNYWAGPPGSFSTFGNVITGTQWPST